MVLCRWAVSKHNLVLSTGLIIYTYSRENKGTDRDIKGVGWDMSIPLKLFLVLDGNGNMIPEKSARSSNYEFSM